MNCNHCGSQLDKSDWCTREGCPNARQPMSAIGAELFMFAATHSALRLAEQGITLAPVEKDEERDAA